MAKATMPRGLGSKARKKWRDISTTYELRADELRILEDACREIDLIEQMHEALQPTADVDVEDKLIVSGSMGQPVASPLLQEIRQHRALLGRLWAQLKLPDEDGRAAGLRSESARAAANERWRRGSQAG